MNIETLIGVCLLAAVLTAVTSSRWMRPNPLKESKRIINILENLDLAPILARVHAETGWTREHLIYAAAYYKAFVLMMALRRRCRGRLAVFENVTKMRPTTDIDKIWHTHMLFSKSYDAMCEALKCGYLHHNPDPVNMSEQALMQRQEEVLQTATAFEQLFELAYLVKDGRYNHAAPHILHMLRMDMLVDPSRRGYLPEARFAAAALANGSVADCCDDCCDDG